MNKNIIKELEFIYEKDSKEIIKKIENLLEEFKQSYIINNKNKPNQNNNFTEKDIILITYADSIKSKQDQKTLTTMKKFLDKFIKNKINTIHFLPFFPYTSDDGFSISDYNKIKEEYGTFDDVKKIGNEYSLMFDFVINHISSSHKWFKEYLKGNKKYKDYFLTYNKQINTSNIFRPRTHPLLTPFKINNKTRLIWTTFSEDQIDVNFKNPEVLLEFVKIILNFINNNAELIRLDAIAFLYKELNTPCIHHPKTHSVVRLLRAISEEITNKMWIVTETNVPHKDNISYFGNGENEAHIVYNFSLPPLLLLTFINENSNKLTSWAKKLKYPSNKTTFLNFTASHDGIGLTPLKGIANDIEIEELAKNIEKKGGKINYRTIPNQKPYPYELNTTYLSALDENPNKFICSQAITLSLKGIPAIYINSLLGETNWVEGVEKLGYNRAINRKKHELEEIEKELKNTNSSKNYIYTKYMELINIKINEKTLSPLAKQEILEYNNKSFCIKREIENEILYCIFNISSKKLNIKKLYEKENIKKKNITYLTNNENKEILKPYEFIWIKKQIL